MLSHKLFSTPPIASRLVPFWFWNASMDREEIIHQIEEMAQKGVGGFFICARQGLTIPYLSEQWFQLVTLAIECAQQYGLHCWLYDEYPYPSGMSGGEVTLLHPDSKQNQLLNKTITIDGPQALAYDLPWARVLSAQAIPLEDSSHTPHWSQALDLSTYIGIVPAESIFQSTGLTTYTNKRFFTADMQKQLVWNVPPGRWIINVFLEKEVDNFKYFGNYVDPCHREAIETFIATTYEPYAQRFQAHFGQTIKGFFTDEVGMLGRIPWSTRLPRAFREHYGYELIPNLPALLYSVNEDTARVRYDFFQALHHLLGESYHKPISSWCEDHNLQYITEVPSMRMTTQRYSHVPGGDSAHEKIGRSLQWILDRYAPSLRADPKIASSLAHQFGLERSAIECFHSVGWSMTLQDAKWMLDRLAALGINFFVFHAFCYSISGLRKHDAPPSQFLQNPYWLHFRHLADYAGRLSYALSQGRAHISIALVHPTTTFWTHMGNPLHNFQYCGSDPAEERALERLKQDWMYLQNQLLLQQIDFDHLDSELLAEASIEGESLIIGQARYDVLILPPMSNLETAAWTRIKAFLQAGGKVISVGLLPHERIDQGLDQETEMLAWFGLTSSPQPDYWHEFEETYAINEPLQTWTKGNHAAYFIPSRGGPQHAQSITQLVELLQICVPSTIRLEPIIGDRRSFLMQQRSLDDGSELLFITHQEGAEKLLRLHLLHHSTRPHIEHLDLTSGQITSIAAEQTIDGWSIPLSFAPYEAHLLRFTYSEQAQPSLATPSERPWQLALDVRQPWQLSTQQNNILRFGAFHFALDLDNRGLQAQWQAGQAEPAWSLVEVKPFINQCADTAATHTFPLQFKQPFGVSMQSSLVYPIHCWYQSTFAIAELPPLCTLLMDEDAIGGVYTIYINGHKITAHDFLPVSPYGYRQRSCDVQRFLTQGTNYLVIHVEAQRDEDGVRDPLYLTGPFGVTFDTPGAPTIDLVPETGIPHGGVQQGYPYFAGTLSFTREISLETIPHTKTFELALQNWDQQIHDCVEILLNGRSLGVCCWSPYRWEGACTILQ